VDRRLPTALLGCALLLLPACGSDADEQATQALASDVATALNDYQAAEIQLLSATYEYQRVFSQLELLDAQRTLLELRRERSAVAVAYHELIIEIEKLLGEPLSAESRNHSKPPSPDFP
jgi:outer membrane protein TolC